MEDDNLFLIFSKVNDEQEKTSSYEYQITKNLESEESRLDETQFKESFNLNQDKKYLKEKLLRRIDKEFGQNLKNEKSRREYSLMNQMLDDKLKLDYIEEKFIDQNLCKNAKDIMNNYYKQFQQNFQNIQNEF